MANLGSPNTAGKKRKIKRIIGYAMEVFTFTRTHVKVDWEVVRVHPSYFNTFNLSFPNTAREKKTDTRICGHAMDVFIFTWTYVNV